MPSMASLVKIYCRQETTLKFWCWTISYEFLMDQSFRWDNIMLCEQKDFLCGNYNLDMVKWSLSSWDKQWTFPTGQCSTCIILFTTKTDVWIGQLRWFLHEFCFNGSTSVLLGCGTKDQIENFKTIGAAVCELILTSFSSNFSKLIRIRHIFLMTGKSAWVALNVLIHECLVYRSSSSIFIFLLMHRIPWKEGISIYPLFARKWRNAPR